MSFEETYGLCQISPIADWERWSNDSLATRRLARRARPPFQRRDNGIGRPKKFHNQEAF
jgi:hypothetical protein